MGILTVGTMLGMRMYHHLGLRLGTLNDDSFFLLHTSWYTWDKFALLHRAYSGLQVAFIGTELEALGLLSTILASILEVICMNELICLGIDGPRILLKRCLSHSMSRHILRA